MDISIAPPVLGYIGSFPITNTVTTSVLITFLALVFGIYAKSTFKLIPTKIQVIIELFVGFILEQLEGAFASKEKARTFFPILMTLLLFIFIANQLTVLPLLGQIIYDGQPAFRTATSDVSMTIALGIVTVLSAHIMALFISPITHLGNYIKLGSLFKSRSFSSFANALLEIFLGLLDIIGEVAKLMSLSFRLFGNILAGELIIAIIGGLSIFTSIIVPVPFMVLSIFSGIVQAVVFAMLSVQFIGGTINNVSSANESQSYDESEFDFTQNPTYEVVPVSEKRF